MDVSRDAQYPCGCFMKVHVCARHYEVAAKELEDLTSQLRLDILDRSVSVSAVENEDGVLL